MAKTAQTTSGQYSCGLLSSKDVKKKDTAWWKFCCYVDNVVLERKVCSMVNGALLAAGINDA
eukprot:7210297-Prorocentrum_lima.AAC.1